MQEKGKCEKLKSMGYMLYDSIYCSGKSKIIGTKTEQELLDLGARVGPDWNVGRKDVGASDGTVGES
jgi:hypothetical protein